MKAPVKRRSRKPVEPKPLLETAPGAEMFAFHVFEKTSDTFARAGSNMPILAFVLMTTDPENGQSLGKVHVGEMAMCPEHVSEDALRRLAQASKAVGVLYLEKMTRIETTTDPTDVEELNELLRERSAETERERSHEVVVARFEHLRFPRTRCWVASIEEQHKLGAFIEQDDVPRRFGSFLAFQN